LNDRSHETVIARELTPAARAALLGLAVALIALGLVLHLAGQALVVDVPLRGTSERAVRVEAAHESPYHLAGGAVAGAGVAVALFAFAHPLVRHKRAPYVAVVLAGLAVARLQAIRYEPVVDRATETLVLRVATAANLALLGAGLALLLAVVALAAWCLLRPFDLEGTPLWRSYLARDALAARGHGGEVPR
jgi:hypothetical protein